MKALVKAHAEPGLWLEDIPDPTIGINDVLIRVHRTGICGTDVHIYEWDSWAQQTIPVPMAIGHEFVGEIAAVGSADAVVSCTGADVVRAASCVDGVVPGERRDLVGLLGAASQLSAADMQAYTDFILSVRYPPNPIRALSNVGTTAQNGGETFFNTTVVDGGTCQNCHRLPFGTDGRMSVEGETQEFKIPHLRNLYQKIGMFGLPPNPLLPNGISGGNVVRGFGFLHDGAVSTVFLFLNAPVFNFANNTQRQQVEAFVLALDTGLRPIVGQQVSANATTLNDTTVTDRITLLIAQAEAGSCDVVVKGNLISRLHARIEINRNKFVLIDQSTNGTFVQAEGGEELFVRRDSVQIKGEGLIGLGRVPERDSPLTIRFYCEEA